MLLNIPVFLWAFWKKGKTFAGKSFAAMILLSLWLSVLPAWNLAGDDMVIGCAFGGGIMGFGIGLVLRTRSTTGGTDMLAALLHMKFQQYSIVRIMQVIDAVIVLAGLSLFVIEERTLCDHSHRDYDKSVGFNSRRIQNVQSSVYFVREERGDCTGCYDGTEPWYDRSACKRHVYPAGKMYAPVCGIKKRDCLAEGNRHENRPKSNSLLSVMRGRSGEKDSSLIPRKCEQNLKVGEMHKKNCISSLLFWGFCLKIELHNKNI